MKYTHEVFSEVDFLSRLLTSNPYTAEGKSILDGLNVKLTTSQFFEEKLYAEPFFLDKLTNTANITNPTENIDEDDVPDNEDYIFISDDDNYFKNLIIRDYERFLKSFNNVNEFPLLFVRGGSGTGKSTYMYRLIYELKKKDPNVFHTELTLEKYTERPSYYGISLKLDSDNTISRFIRVVFTKIFSIIKCEIENAVKFKNYDKINNAFIHYKKMFSNCPSEKQVNRSTFEALGNSEFQKLDDCVKYNQKVIEEYIQLTSGSSKVNVLSDLLLLLIELCYCFNFSKFNLISFDGIEYLINRTHHIYDADINDIIMAFEQVKNCAETLFEECNQKFARNFKIILAIRNATIDYCNDREQERIRDVNISVDVTNWYRIENIYEARINYFTEHNYICKDDFDKIKDIVDVIIKDSNKGRQRASGAMDMLERMYNFDKRSLQINLLTAVSQIVLGSEGGILKDKFITFYNDIGAMVYHNNKQGHRFRYLCRRAVIRILLNQIERESSGTFFDGIYFSELGDECMQSSYMRKMLIFLMHNQVVDNKIADDYVPFIKVINAITRSSNHSVVTDSAIEKIVTLIYRLSDFRLHDSAWQQIISIRVGHKEEQTFCNEEQFVAKIKELYFNGGLANSKYGIKLNYAGAFLAYIQSDFEFFACRCKKFRVPLIFTNDVNYITSLLDEVHSRAVNCIKMVIEDEKNIFRNYKDMYVSEQKYLYKVDAYNPNGRLLSHPERIINNHIMYLEHYKCFVNNETSIFLDGDIPIIIAKIDEVVNKYKLDYNDLVDGYGSEDGDFAGDMFLKDYSNIPYLEGRPKLE